MPNINIQEGWGWGYECFYVGSYVVHTWRDHYIYIYMPQSPERGLVTDIRQMDLPSLLIHPSSTRLPYQTDLKQI